MNNCTTVSLHHLKLFGNFRSTNAPMFFPRQQTVELTHQGVFQSPRDSPGEENYRL